MSPGSVLMAKKMTFLVFPQVEIDNMIERILFYKLSYKRFCYFPTLGIIHSLFFKLNETSGSNIQINRFYAVNHGLVWVEHFKIIWFNLSLHHIFILYVCLSVGI